MRRVLKWVSLTLLSAAVAAVLAAPYLKRELEERVRRAIESRASQALGVKVSIARLQIALAPPALWLREVRLSRSGNRGSEAEGTIDRIELRADVLTMLRVRRGAL